MSSTVATSELTERALPLGSRADDADADARLLRVTRSETFPSRAFLQYWRAAAVSGFGTYVTVFALQALVVLTLHGSAADVGWLNAARWLPYLVFGLVVVVFGVAVAVAALGRGLVGLDPGRPRALGRGVTVGAGATRCGRVAFDAGRLQDVADQGRLAGPARGPQAECLGDGMELLALLALEDGAFELLCAHLVPR